MPTDNLINDPKITETAVSDEEISNIPTESDIPSESDIPASEAEAEEKNNEEELRSKINSLRKELDELQRSKEEFLKAETEKNELLSLFPNANVDSLPDGVVKEMEKGLPMAAAYAVYERKQYIRSKEIDTHNDSTKKSGFGKIRTESTVEFFSPSEVRAMSKSEVKKNYKRIIQSMKSWN